MFKKTDNKDRGLLRSQAIYTTSNHVQCVEVQGNEPILANLLLDEIQKSIRAYAFNLW